MNLSKPIKRIARKYLSVKHQRFLEKLNRERKTTIADCMAKGWLGLIKVFPKRLRAAIKENFTLVTKMDYPNHEILLNINSQLEYSLRTISCKKEPETIGWIEEYIKPGETIFDIGANVGAYSLVIDKFLEGHCQVYAFEPSFSNFSQLSTNIFLNQAIGRVIPLSIALSDRTEIGNFHYSSLVSGTATHTLEEIHSSTAENQSTIVYKQPIVCYRLDDFIEYFGVPIPNHIKLDVDGLELSILRGGVKTLNHSSLKTILVEIEEGSQRSIDLIYLLKEAGFALLTQHKHGPIKDRVYNYNNKDLDVNLLSKTTKKSVESNLYNCIFVRT